MMLSLAIHNHQPVGNFGWVFEEGFQKSYLPMVECLERHPSIRLALHYTGPLRDWILALRPDFFPRVRALVERGQVEIMTGGYYEPVLVALPEADQRGQIQKLNDAVEADFGVAPSGLWLAERVWEPHLPRVLAESGIAYTIVDDSHFKSVGHVDDDLLGTYVAEEQGHTLKILPTSMGLRYSIPWGKVEDVIAWLREQANAEDPTGRYEGRQKVAVMGDDGEKFGLWPGTYAHVWAGGWMDAFFEAVAANAEWLATITPGDFVRDHLSLGRVLLPSGSYDEMDEWALPPERAWRLAHLKHEWRGSGRNADANFLRGSHWRAFMVKYPEVNHLHKKALWVSQKVHAMQAGQRQQEALDALWAGQCNCAYWHGVFGGVYLFHIRAADYERLIAAENTADGLDREAKPFVRADRLDFDRDGIEDVALTSDRFELVFDLARGGSLVEWDYRPARYNLLNVLTRRREGYHHDLEEAAAEGQVVLLGMRGTELENIHTQTVRAREAGLEKLLHYDWYRRGTLIDHFLPPHANLENFYRADYGELGDFVTQPYQVEIGQPGKNTITLTLRRQGMVWQGEQAMPVGVQKRVTLQAGQERLEVRYSVANEGDRALDTRFGVEANWGLAGGESAEHAFLTLENDGERHNLADKAAHDSVTGFAIETPLWGFRIQAEVDRAAGLWRFPLETVSNSEAGFERLYQGTTTLLWWPLKLAAGEAWHVNLTFDVEALSPP